MAAIEERIARGVIPLRVEPWIVQASNPPADIAGTLALRNNEQCVFFEAHGSGCAVHDVKPASCAHFPYVCLIDPRGVHVTLSHYCPTAASLLFEHDGPIAIVEGPSPLPDLELPEGLDARDALPPVRTGAETLMSWEDVDAWQHDRVTNARVDEWQPDDLELFEAARAAVPAPLTWPHAPGNAEALFFSMAAPAWPQFAGVLTRYAAAKAFASWSLYLGSGIGAADRTARIAHAVLRVECARQCQLLGRPLDRALLKRAIEQSDLLLVHYADPGSLAGVK